MATAYEKWIADQLGIPVEQFLASPYYDSWTEYYQDKYNPTISSTGQVTQPPPSPPPAPFYAGPLPTDDNSQPVNLITPIIDLPGTPAPTQGGVPLPEPGPAPGTTPPAPPNQAEPTQAQLDSKARLTALFNQYGLGSLADWAWQQILAGVSEDHILLDLHNQPAYKARFPYEDALLKAGLPALSPDEMLRVEAGYKATQLKYGVQPTNNPQDYLKLFTGQVSNNEFEDRVSDYNKLRTVYGPYIRDHFNQALGITNVSDDDLYSLLSGQDNKFSAQYQAVTGNPLNISFASLKEAEARALSENQAQFQAGGRVENQNVTPSEAF